MEELYETLGYAKCVELSKKSRTFWEMLKLAENRKNAPVGGVVREGIAKDFVREFLPSGFGLKSGLIFDAERKRTSPQCDAIIYRGVPLLDFTDIVVVEKEQVKAIFEIKAWIDQGTIFGKKARTLEIRTVVWLLPLNTERISFQQELGTFCLLFLYLLARLMPKSLKDSRKFAILMLSYFVGRLKEEKNQQFTTLITPSQD